MNRNELLESIAGTVRDYRSGEIPTISANGINRWVSQFNSNEQLIILSEINHLFKKYYISLSKTRKFLNSVLALSDIFGDNLYNGIKHTKFLNIQRKGSSQKDLLKLTNEISVNKYHVDINRHILNPISYIYLDDCLFTGNTVIYDLESWVENNIVKNVTIHLVFLGIYTSGFEYLNRRLVPKLSERGISIKTWRMLEFKNSQRNPEEYDCFWPGEVVEDDFVNTFVGIVRGNAEERGWNPRLFRPNTISPEENFFSSLQNRKIIEKAFLKKGSYLCSLPRNRQHSMRPMGYEYLESLGFGSDFITYRNISNNCPLVLWWGDTDYPASHPFSNWYPLFPRKTNERPY